ncbi:uncharacterized protein LOC119731809 [Patiria miniata]|uniref:Protein kinase domain-containing protein n=1 Tax=Patiria miniata TaxID=46514 RepID=A0A914AAW1_PATMI|nr:uncharacterized protein LOC119731809 [Patiria miniata]
MFRFASEFASVKFRSLSGYRLVSLQPAAAARRDAIALSPNCPPVKFSEEVMRRPETVHHKTVTSQQSRPPAATECRERSGRDNKSDDSGYEKSDLSPQHSPSTSQQRPNQDPPLTASNGGSTSQSVAEKTGDGDSDNDCPARVSTKVSSKTTSEGTSSPLISITAPQDDIEMGGDQVGELETNDPDNTRPQISPHSLGSPSSLPRIDKSDLNPVMTLKGNSYSAVKLGKGEFGEVSLMQSRSDGTLMAVKRLTKLRNPCRAEDAFTRETQAMDAVSSSKAFPKFLGTVDRYSFAMESIGNLDKRTSWSAYQMFKKRSNQMKSLDWLKVASDVTKGLMDMHEAGWTHNDLHSDNVMVCRDPENQSTGWEGKIIDLGYAYRIDNPPPPQQLTAKQKKKHFKDCAQLAPEIIEGTSCYNVQSDVYSLGVLFQDIAAESRRLSCLKALGKRCANKTPHMRPALDEVLQELSLMHYERLTQPRKNGPLANLFRSLKNRIRA